MPKHVSFYCPDHHLAYDLDTLDRRGVGGGITSRLRMAHALAARGHRVTAYVNCPREALTRGVDYRQVTRAKEVETDVFVASTSGGGLDLRTLRDVRVRAGRRILMVHGVDPPLGLDVEAYDFVYAASNFVGDTLVQRWGVPADRVFVSPRGVVERFFRSGWPWGTRRDPYALAYAAHPSKGLDAALSVLRLLREQDPRFTLHVFGGHGLWGETGRPAVALPGVIDHGLIGQRRLARELRRCGFCLALQARQEPFGIVVVEAMRAGCIVVASPVGAYPELIRHGWNGVLIPGAHTDHHVHSQAARWVSALSRCRDQADGLRGNAMRFPLDWDRVARAWEGHWEWAGHRHPDGSAAPKRQGKCARCGGGLLCLADGHHCVTCGRYSRETVP